MSERTRRVEIDDGTSGNYWGSPPTYSGSNVPFGSKKYVEMDLPFDMHLGGNGTYFTVVNLWSSGIVSLGFVTQEQIDFMNSAASPIPGPGNAGFPGEFFVFDYTPGLLHPTYSFGIGRADYTAPYDYASATPAVFFTFKDSFQIILDQNGFSILPEIASDGVGTNGYYIGSNAYNTSSDANNVSGKIDFSQYPDFFTYSGTAVADTIVGTIYPEIFLSSAGADSIDGASISDYGAYLGSQLDSVSYANSPAGVTVSLATGLGSGGYAAGDTLTNIEALIGSAFADTLTGDAYNNIIEGGPGADILDGGSGPAFDRLSYLHSPAGVTVSLADGTASGGDASGDTFVNFEHLQGSNFADTLTGTDTANYLYGEGGDDILIGLGGNDTLFGGEGNNLMIGGAGADTFYGGSGVDTVSYAGSPSAVTINLSTSYSYSGGDAAGDHIGGDIDAIVGSAFNDTITVDMVLNRTLQFFGGDGNDTLSAISGNFVLDGGNGNDLIIASYGTVTALGGAGDDGIVFVDNYFNATDYVDGGPGTNDQLGLQGDYSAGLTFGANSMLNIEALVLLPGSDTRFKTFGGAPLFSYNLTTVDANVAAGQLFVVNWNTLRAGENVTFNGASETNGSFLAYGGAGNDAITGGQQVDGFYFGGGKFGAGDTLVGGAGNDQLGLQGDYSGANAVTFGAGQLTSIESIVLLSGADTRFGGGGAQFNYTITMNDANVAAGVNMIVNANTLRSNEVLTFNGAAETNGSFSIFGGAGNDVITTGAGNDTIYGGAGADTLTGGAGNDSFVYLSAAHSTVAAQDHIVGFGNGTDIVNLSAIDAIAGGANDAFTFIGSVAFSNVAGQLRAYDNGAGTWYAEGDTNGDGVPDLSIAFDAPLHALTSADFVL